MSKLRDLLTERISAKDKSCTLHPYSVATRNFADSDATACATGSQQTRASPHAALIPNATTDATGAQQTSCTTLSEKEIDATAVAERAVALAPLAADGFWQTLRARIDECDELIHRVCDLRGEPDEYRAEMLAIRKRMAPAKLDSDIAYLKNEIQQIKKATR